MHDMPKVLLNSTLNIGPAVLRYAGRRRRGSPDPSYLGRGGNTIVASGNWTGSLAGMTTAEGDLLVAVIAYRGSAPFAMPAGWTQIAQESTGNTDATAVTAVASGLMAYIIRSATVPDLTFTRTLGDVAQGRIIAYRNVHRTNPFIGGVSRTLPANGTIVATAAGITTDAANALLVIGCCGAVNSSSVAAGLKANTDPTTGWTERFDDNTATGGTTNASAGDAIKAAAGDTGALQWQSSATTRPVIVAGAFRKA